MGEGFGGGIRVADFMHSRPYPLERRLASVRIFGGDVGGVFVGVFGGGKWEMSRILGIE